MTRRSPPPDVGGWRSRGKSRFRFTEVVSSPKIKNISQYFALPEPKITGTSWVSRPDQRGVRTSRTWGGDAVDARAALDERGRRVRQKRVVPTSQCWRQCSWETFDFPGRYGGKRAVLRGERAISRKATAQGMSDVLRCPVCSWAHFLCTLAHETAGAARIRHSLRPLNWRRAKRSAKLRAHRAARMRNYVHVIASEAKQSRVVGGTLDCFVALLLAMTVDGASPRPYRNRSPPSSPQPLHARQHPTCPLIC